MESIVSTTIIAAFILVAINYAWKVMNWAWFRPKRIERCLREQGFSGNPYKLLYGDIEELKLMTIEATSKRLDPSSDDIEPRIRPFHQHCSHIFGKSYFTWLGPTPRLIISDPKLIREMLLNHQDFQRIEKTLLVKQMLTGLLGHEGEKWVKHRSLLTPAFSLDKLKHMVPEMNACTSEMIKKWDGLLQPEGSSEIDVWPFLVEFSGDVISRSAFGSNYGEGKKIFQLLREQIDIVFNSFKSFRTMFLPSKAVKKRLADINNEIKILLTGIINNKQKAMKAGRGDNNLLAILLDTISRENQEQPNKMNLTMSIEEVIEECKLFYIAGQESTSVLLVWTMILLSKNQKWQKLAREEVFTVFGDREPDYDGLNQLKTVTMILYEVLRLYPPAPITARRTYKNVKLGDKILPPGVEVEIPFITVQHDTDLWGEDANEFNPERFSGGIANASRVKGAFLTFSGGPRICIGQNFTLIEAKVALAKILRSFSFSLSPSYKHTPTLLLTIQPGQGARLIMHKI